MLDRQENDIDALLIGALYGELTPADEAWLSAHLDSHPADKSALADLTFARNAVRESRFLTVQLEPPQAVSALLLQEASRRAPATAQEPPHHEGWFQRFVSSFVRHPAMAAAAMLVLVVGVAGTMYVRNGNKAQIAEQTTSSRDQAPAGAPAPAAEPTVLEEAKELQLRAGSSFETTLADPEATGKTKADQATAATHAEKPRTYIGVPTGGRPQPKDLEAAPSAPADFSGGVATEGDARGSKGGATTGNAAPDTVQETRNERAPVIASPSPPPPPRAPQATTPRGAGAGAGVGVGGVGGEDARKDKSLETEESTWAREQHTRVTNAVKANSCKDATSLAVQLSNRTPAYYKEHVENDRELKQCLTYINAEREKTEQQRARVLQKRSADEADRARRATQPTTNSK